MFAEEAHSALTAIRTGACFLREVRASYLIEDGPQGMSEAERDEIDAEAQHILRACGERIDGVKRLVSTAPAGRADGSVGGSKQTAGVQLMAHRQATLQLLYEQLSRVAAIFDEHRGHRLKRAAEVRDQRLGAAAAAAGTLSNLSAQGTQLHGAGRLSGALGGALGTLRPLGGPGMPSSDTGAAATVGISDAVALEWGEEEVLPDDESLDATERAQLQVENEALVKELETMVEQAREAESSMLEISKLSHLFATKVEQQSTEVEMLSHQAEQTSENLVRGNAYLDSAAKHSRDFRLLVLSFLLIASFALLFLDYFYD